jgi:uncharacterized membrane protein
MTWYESVKIVHILGTVLLFGTGLGTAFFLLMAYRSRDIDAIRVTTRHVVVADWLFTAPAVVVQPLTGALLMYSLGLPYGTAWFAAVAALYVLTGLCWLPVVRIQYRLRELAQAAPRFDALPPAFHRRMRIWIVLGIPAFSAVLLIVVLMVTRAGMERLL